MDIKDTLSLPKTDFPMRADLVNREPKRVDIWAKQGVYDKIQKKNASGEVFVLHDGPPFTNGDVHIGTAFNKILKDIIVRHRSMMGFRTPYVPGWDCHGLPIEHKVAKELNKQNKKLDTVSLRHECANFSRNYIKKQRGQFERLGILADWKHEYCTMDPAYEGVVINFFADCVEQGLIYRGKKPVYWSIPCKTALAEAEIEYKNHVSKSIWVKFKMDKDSVQKLGIDDNTYIVIWTTTPWTIPSNLAIAVHPNFTYAAVEVKGECYIVCADLVEKFAKECSLQCETIKTFKGSDLENLSTEHPIIDRGSKIVLATYVTTDAGTGCVHTAPGHGLEDYATGLNYGLDIYSPLDDDGRYTNDGHIPKELVGVSVLEESAGKCEANDRVIELLAKAGALVHQSDVAHQYPYCWRSKTPVIFRAMDQWFIAIDKGNLRQRLLDAVGTVSWLPAWGENRIRAAIETRPDWCISRQRAWGIPLPVFYTTEGDPLLDKDVTVGIAKKISQHGSNFWFEASVGEILSGIDVPKSWDIATIRKSTDTLDVWIDSGNSHRAVLKNNGDLSWPADLYLEGSDQHRGWFQSSLWTSVISENGRAPFKAILTHGFVVDEDKKKVSKSDSKPQTADDYVNRFGADVVRLWVASEDFRTDITISDVIFDHVVSTYRTIRNTLRFQIGNLCDFDEKSDKIEQGDMTIIDKWILQKTRRLIDETNLAYTNFDMHRVYQLVNRFCAVELSSIYHDVLKDRLYTHAFDSHERRSSQSAIFLIINTLIAILSPILTFTCDEALAFLVSGSEFSAQHAQLLNWPGSSSFMDFEAEEREVDLLLKFRDAVNEKLEHARQEKLIGQSLDARVIIECAGSDKYADVLKKYVDTLEEIFIVSQVELHFTSSEATNISVKHARGEKCPRSWKWCEQLFDAGKFGKVSKDSLVALKAKHSDMM
ncbi:MAG: isoleucine--tRNA ligase [Puniceicoccales bacterium]|jgi:isoleucyl-tRNA synthetase|nr:isoleucine--tRNA ligase [Puniceicoccales bacterium]